MSAEGNSEHGDESMLQVVDRARNLSISDETFLTTNNFSVELQSPLTWKECVEKFDDIDWVKNLKWKLTRESHEFRIYFISVLLGCVQAHLKDEEATVTFDSCEKLVEGQQNERFFREIKEGLEHVLFSSRLFFFRLTGREDAAEEMLPRIKLLKNLNKMCQAAVFGTKANILRLFGYGAKHEALKCARLAIELDPDDLGYRRGAWYYLAGKILAEIRRTESFGEKPSDEELQLLERSVKKDPFPPHIALLADTYREIAKANHRSSHRTRELDYQNQILLKKAVKMYEDCIKDTNASTVVLARCGFGLIKVPKQFRNVKLAKEAFERAMKTGSRRATIGMGHLLDWCVHDYKEALKYFEKAYSAEAIITGLEIIKMKFKIDKDYNPLEDCDKFIKDLECMMEARQKYELTVAYCLLKSEYLLVERKDLLAAIKEWRIAMNQQHDSKYLWESKCWLKRNSDLILCNLISMEIQKALKQKKFSGNDEKYLKEFFEEFQAHWEDYQDKKLSGRNRR